MYKCCAVPVSVREQVPRFEQEPTGEKQCEAERQGRGKSQFAACLGV